MRVSRPAGLLRSFPAFRALWVSRAVSFTGDGVARVALVLLTARSGPGAVGLVLLANTLPRLLGPVAGAIADRVDQRRLMIGCELGQAAAYTVLAVLTPPLPVLLPVVAAAALLATVFTPAGKSSVPQLVPEGRLPQANALLGVAFNLQIVAGPALGGVLVGFAGTRPAFAADAASFIASALLLARVPALPPPSARSERGVLADTAAGLSYVAHRPVMRALAIGTLLFVSFAAIDNVALVFLVRDRLHGSQSEYGIAVAAFGVGMLLASLALTRFGDRQPPRRWLLAGVLGGTVGTGGTALAPTPALAMAGQILAGAGNTADLVATDTLIQQLVPRPLLGRAFGAVATAAQIGSAIAYLSGAALVAATGARTALLVSAAGMTLGLAALKPVIRHRPEPQR